jgi:uncharacterized damage-inducible protein DinB
MELGRHYLETVRFELSRLKALAEKAMEQVPNDDGLHFSLDPEANSIAVLVQHLSGNLRSRWTKFLETDGEKPDRNRDGEFEAIPDRTKEELTELWEAGWSRALETLDSLRPEDLERKVRIRGEELTVPEAMQRQLAHTAYHVGQIVLLAKHLSSSTWKSLSIPRGASKGVAGAYKKA